MAKLPWRPWHEVVKLRKDLQSGDLPLHLFAADLYEVVMQGGKLPVYEDPVSFFALTYPTHNLRNFARDVVLRLAGQNDKAVRQLELTYGGGKTHTLITLRHLVHDPATLPDVPAVQEFEQTIGLTPPKARVAALCFDKVDVESGCDVRAPDGKIRRLKYPWSILAFQIAGDAGLKLLHPEGRPEERRTPPAEPMLAALLALPAMDKLSTLVLVDEVLLYAKVKVRSEPGWLDLLSSFFQYLTQAAAKVPRCCIVASLLSSEPKDQADELGKRIVSELYDIFQRQREETVQPVEKGDVAEVLRRRLLDTSSLQDRQAWRQHVIAAIKGISSLDAQTAKAAAAEEERYLQSYPFHPELTDVFYSKWAAGIERFQKTRGVLRTFALALREAEKWDESPLVGPAVFLNAPDLPVPGLARQTGSQGLSEAGRELVAIADTIVVDGQANRWTGILEAELNCARQVEEESVGLRLREIQQAVMATFLHSQPTGRSAKARDLMLLIGPCRPDRIELEKALVRWAHGSYWLDDANLPEKDDQLPDQWRLGNRPNLTQMQAAAAAQFSPEVVRARLVEEIPRVRGLVSGAAAAGVRVHMLPAKPRDIEDDGLFHYAIMPPTAASDSGKPSAETRRFLDEKIGPDNPRVFRNAVLLLAPSRDGLGLAEASVRDLLAWEKVRQDLAPGGNGETTATATVDIARMETLRINLDRAKRRVPETIRQAWCIVVTVSKENEAQAFKITVTDDGHFDTIKRDGRSRVIDTPITADALLPAGPYSLWKQGETSRRVKDLAGAFAQLPHLPKMLKSQAIVDTLVDGCVQGTFVLRLMRPDRTFRTWWRNHPDETALSDPAMELVLPEAAELAEIAGELLAPSALPGLWPDEELSVQAILDYFGGGRSVQVDKGGFAEAVPVPKAAADVVKAAVEVAVASGGAWLLSGPASLLGEAIPAGVLSPTCLLRMPPEPVSAAAILPENLPAAWQAGVTTALAILTALSQKAGRNLPWKTARDVIGGALQARFIELADNSAAWPCDLPAAQGIRLKASSSRSDSAIPAGHAPGGGGAGPAAIQSPIASADFEPSQIQDLAELMPQLLGTSAKAGVTLKFHVRLEIGDGGKPADDEAVKAINLLLEQMPKDFRVF